MTPDTVATLTRYILSPLQKQLRIQVGKALLIALVYIGEAPPIPIIARSQILYVVQVLFREIRRSVTEMFSVRVFKQECHCEDRTRATVALVANEF